MTLVSERLVDGVGPENLAPGEIALQDVWQMRTEKSVRYEKHRVTVGDEGNPLERQKLNLTQDMWNDFLDAHADEFPIPKKKNGFKKNPAYEWFYNFESPDFEGTMQEWLTLVPSARALYAMQVLDDMERVFPSGKVTERTRNILTNSDDAVAIRARAAIMKSIVLESAEKSTESHLNFVSLGAGAAVPAINAVLEIQRAFGKTVEMHLYDKDEDILEFAEDSTRRAGIPSEQVTTHPGDYHEAFNLPEGSVDMLEALGLFEYLEYSRCVSLIQDAYKLLKSGGVMVFSNMLDSRSQLAFNQRGVAWPGVKPRTEQQLIQMVIDAEIDTSLITYTVSDDGVYGIVEIHKP